MDSERDKASPESRRRGWRGFRRDSVTTRRREMMRAETDKARWIADVMGEGEEERNGEMEFDMDDRGKGRRV